jgi:hypothetical protein
VKEELMIEMEKFEREIGEGDLAVEYEANSPMAAISFFVIHGIFTRFICLVALTK